MENVPADGVRGKQHNAFYFRTNRRWNELPPNVANAKTINEFKNELDDAWKEKTTNDELHDENADENEDAWANRRDSEFVCDLKYMIIIIIIGSDDVIVDYTTG